MRNFALLIEVIDLDQPDACAAVNPAHHRGVISWSDRRDQGGFVRIVRRNAGGPHAV